MNIELAEHTIEVGGAGEVSALYARPRGARWLYVMAHGAGAGMRHPFLSSMADRLARRKIATLRYQFPFMEAGKKRTDAPALAIATVRAAVEAASTLAPRLPVIAGGKSFGGRMTSQAQADDRLPGVRGLAFLGFPLHPPGRPGTSRAAHLASVAVPMLFLQGTRDTLADLVHMHEVVGGLGERATMHVVEGGDHSFKTPKSAGRSEGDIFDELADALAAWAERI